VLVNRLHNNNINMTIEWEKTSIHIVAVELAFGKSSSEKELLGNKITASQ
jgi:hypothetical protein